MVFYQAKYTVGELCIDTRTLQILIAVKQSHFH